MTDHDPNPDVMSVRLPDGRTMHVNRWFSPSELLERSDRLVRAVWPGPALRPRNIHWMLFDRMDEAKFAAPSVKYRPRRALAQDLWRAWLRSPRTWAAYDELKHRIATLPLR